MRPLNFDHWIDEGLHSYRYVAHEGPIVERNWPGLFAEWPDRGPTPYSEYAVNNNNTEEIVVYLGLIWRLTAGLVLYAVPRYWRDDAMYAAGAPYALIDWEYEVGEDGDELGAIRGFVPARSSVRISPPPTPWEKEHAEQAGFFELPVFSTFRDLVRGLLSDATAEMNLYALKKWNAPDVVQALSGKEPPRVQDLLRAGELFIDLVIGVDAGYSDVIVVHSHDDLAGKLFPLSREYEAAIESYEREVEGIATVEEFLSRIETLLDLGDEAEVSRWGAT